MNNEARAKYRSHAALISAAVVIWTAWLWFCLSPPGLLPPPDFISGHFSLPPAGDLGQELDLRGKLGDAFGPFNALVSTIALGILLVTLNLQRKQIDQQHEQLALQKQQIDSEFKLIRQQQFQEQFFRAIDGYQQQLSALTAGHGQTGGEPVRNGRDALNHIVRTQLYRAMGKSPHIGNCVGAQMQTNDDVLFWHRSLAEQVSAARQRLSTSQNRQGTLALLRKTWAAVYFQHRFQFDALFRAWYTVYRILDTAPTYHIDENTIWLYGASFRAQLSWIELLVLLLNQSDFEAVNEHPRACRYSNKYCVFDNLAVDSDIIAMILRDEACAKAPLPGGDQLNEAAFTRRAAPQGSPPADPAAVPPIAVPGA